MSIDFDGTNDGYNADISAFGSYISPIFVQGFFNYDAALGVRTLLRFSDGALKTATLSKSGVTLTWEVTDLSLPANKAVTATISAATWTGFQIYADGTNIGLRVWTSGIPGSFTTNTDLALSGLNTLYIGYNGTTNFFNGRLAELYVATYSGGLSSQYQKVIDNLAVVGNPLNVYGPLYQDIVIDNLGNIGLYWPMYNTGHLYDLFNKAQLTAVDAPSSHASHPRKIIQSHGKKVYKKRRSTKGWEFQEQYPERDIIIASY